jgi:hypothetical protein
MTTDAAAVSQPNYVPSLFPVKQRAYELALRQANETGITDQHQIMELARKITTFLLTNV